MARSPPIQQLNPVQNPRVHGITQVLFKDNKESSSIRRPVARPQFGQNKPSNVKPVVVRPASLAGPIVAPKFAAQANVKKPKVEVKPEVKPARSKPVPAQHEKMTSTGIYFEINIL